MPLPKSLIEKIHNQPDSLIEWLVSYFSIKCTNELSNFRYVCNDALGDFILKNKEYLPLILTELKIGHCEFLSWYLAGLLRSFGRPAWIAVGYLTCKNETAGDSFNGSCKHAVVITVNHKNELIQIDPSALVDIDPGYNQKILTPDLVAKLQLKFEAAKTINAKAKVLREFDLKLPKLREQAKQNHEVQREFAEMGTNYFELLGSAKINLSSNRVYQKQIKLNWQELSEEFSFEQLRVRVEMLESVHCIFSIFYPFKLFFQRLNRIQKTQELRMAHSYIMRTLYSHKFEMNDIYTDEYNKDFTLLYEPELYYKPERLLEKLLLSSKSFQKKYKYRDVANICNDADLIISGKLSNFTLVDTAKQHIYMVDFTNYINSHIEYLFTCCDYDAIESTGRQLPKNFVINAIYFDLEIYQSLTSPEYRQSFLAKINQDESWFKSRINRTYFDNNRKPLKILEQVPQVSSRRNKPLTKILYIQNDQKLRISSFMKSKFLEIDFRPSQIRTRVDGLHRQYSEGDDLRLMDWNAMARLGTPYVRILPYNQRDLSNPLHVVIHLDSSSDPEFHVNQFKLLEIIKYLQSECLFNKRLIYITELHNNSYVKIHPHLTPERYLDFLFKSENNNAKLRFDFIHNNKHEFPRNLLFISGIYPEIQAVKYIYGKRPDVNLHTIYLHEPELRLYPLVREEWVSGEKLVEVSEE